LITADEGANISLQTRPDWLNLLLLANLHSAASRLISVSMDGRTKASKWVSSAPRSRLSRKP